MPYCSKISDFDIKETDVSWEVTVDLPLPPNVVGFRAIFQGAFPGTGVQSVTGSFFTPWKYAVQIPKAVVRKETLTSFLNILRWTVTISDRADESHALYLHNLPHPTGDLDEVEFRRTRMGNLVNRAKSYNQYTGSKSAAEELSERFKYWIERHPRYRAAELIVPAPPGNLSKVFDLPLFISEHVSRELRMPLLECEKVGIMQQQKEVEQDQSTLHANVSGKFRVNHNLHGRVVLLIDDLYRSGATINEMVRACRAAGGQVILSLVATKTARFCSGLTPSDWYDVSREAEEGLGG